MDDAIIPALVSFAFAATITPVRRSIQHLLGISVGVLPIILLAGVGLMTIFEAVPELETMLRVVSTGYLLWLSWKIASAAPPKTGDAAGKPLSFFQAAAFQWVNPKVWATGLSATALFAPEGGLISVVLVALTFAIIGLAANAVWAWMGTVLQHWLMVGRRLPLFNIAMAVLLVVSLYPAWRH